MGNAEITAALNAWIDADIAMRAAVAAELEARAYLQTLAFPAPTEGTNNQPLPDGRTLKGTFKNSYNLEQDKIEATLKLLPKAVAQSLVKWKGEIKLTAYKGLEPAHKALINEILTIKPGRPALEIVTPKER